MFHLQGRNFACLAITVDKDGRLYPGRRTVEISHVNDQRTARHTSIEELSVVLDVFLLYTMRCDAMPCHPVLTSAFQTRSTALILHPCPVSSPDYL